MTTIIEIQAYLQNLKSCRISFSEIGKALDTGRANISKRANSNSHLKEEEIKKIEDYFGFQYSKQTVNNDIIKIPYWSQLPEELKNPDFSCVTAEKNVIVHHWYLEPKYLCIVPMVGDKMAHYWYPIADKDILIVNTEQNCIMGNGVYFATSRNNTRLWIREMQALINDDVQIKSFAPSGEVVKVFTPQQLKEVDFKIIGKVIKNVSFRL